MNNFRVIFIFFIMSMNLSCSFYDREARFISKNAYDYKIKNPKGWSFFLGSTDGSTYYNPDTKNFVGTEAIMIKGDFEAIVEIFVLNKKNDNVCKLYKKELGDYDETDSNDLPKIIFKNNKISIKKDVLDKWYNDSEDDLVRVYFSLDEKNCILFTLQNKSQDKKNIGDAFYNIIKSLNRKKLI